MYDRLWYQALVSFGIVALVMGITFPISRIALKRQYARRTYDTYVLGDGIVNSVTLTVDVKFSEAERRRILLEHGKVLATYAPSFDPATATTIRPLR